MLYVAAMLIGAVLAVTLRAPVCALFAAKCWLTMVQTVPITITAVAGLVLWGWKLLVVNRVARRTGQSAEHIASNSPSIVRRSGLTLLAFALGWLVAGFVHTFVH